MSDKLNVFISYAREDGREYADRLYRAFNDRGISAWRDERNINPYQDFSGEIEKAIEDSTHVIACLTPSIAQRKDSFVRREILYAQGWEKPITPLLMPGFDKRHIPTLINHLTWIDFTDFTEGLKQFLLRIKQIKVLLPQEVVDDPFRDYLNALYRDIVDFLDSTVFSLVSLHAETKSDAVIKSPTETKPRALPMGFVGLKMQDKQEYSEETNVQFNNFHESVEYYKGRVLLLGEPGGGKTTTLMAYAREAVAHRLEDSSLPLPLLAPISSWDTRYTSIEEWLCEIITLVEPEEIIRHIAQGKALLILDGLDELGVSQTDVYETGTDARHHFVDAFAHCSLTNQAIVSCRLHDYEEMGERIVLRGGVVLHPLDDTQIAEYLVEQPDLLAAIRADVSLQEMVRTPLLLSLLTFAYGGMGDQARNLRDLSHTPADLRNAIFKSYVERRYEREQMRVNISLAYPLERMYAVLGHVAMLDTTHWKENEIPAHQIALVLQEEPVDFLAQAMRLHVLMLQSEEQQTYRFIHLLLRDYFAFEQATKLLQDETAVDHWEIAAEALGKIQDIRSVPLLCKRLKAPSIDIRRTIIEALGQLKDVSAIEVLKTALSDDDPSIRRAAVEALGRIAQPNSINELAVVALHDQNFEVRYSAAWALAQIEEADVTEPFVKLLLTDSTQTEISLISHDAPPDSNEGDSDLNKERLLEELFSKVELIEGYVPPIDDEETEDDDWLKEPDVEVESTSQSSTYEEDAVATRLKDNAMWILRVINDVRRAKMMAHSGGGFDDSFWQASENPVKTLAELIEESKHENPNIRWAAAYELNEQIDEAVVEPLIQLLNDTDLRVQEIAVCALVKRGVQRALKQIILTPFPFDENLRDELVKLLNQQQTGVESLILALDNPDRIVRCNAIRLLGRCSDDTAAEKLLSLLHDPDAHIRIIAAQTLEKNPRQQAIELLLKALHDTDVYVRGYTAEAIYQLGKPAVEPLVAALNDPDAGVRWYVARLLGALGDAETVPYLKNLLEDYWQPFVWSQKRVCDWAAEALHEIGTPEAISIVEAWEQKNRLVSTKAPVIAEEVEFVEWIFDESGE